MLTIEGDQTGVRRIGNIFIFESGTHTEAEKTLMSDGNKHELLIIYLTTVKAEGNSISSPAAILKCKLLFYEIFFNGIDDITF